MPEYASPYVLLLVVSAAVSGAVAAGGWRRRSEPGGTAFAATLALVTVWTATYAVALVTPGEGARLLLERVRWTATAFVVVPWVVFALEYTGLEAVVTPRRIAGLLAVPLATAVAVWTNPAGLFWEGYTLRTVSGVVVLRVDWGALFPVFLAYTYVLVLVGTGLLLRAAFVDDDLYTDQVVSLVAAALVPTAVSALGAVEHVPVPGLDPTPYASAVSGVLLANALVRYRFLDLVPATRQIGRDAVVRNMRDGVVVLDEDGEVLDANPVAERAFDRDRVALIGRPAGEVLTGVQPGPDGWSGEVEAAEEGRTFEVHSSPMLDQGGRVAGTILVLRDVTDRRNREQRLTVLNRVLRHNFRNDMNAVDGYATMLAERLDEPEASTARAIREVSEEIVDLADKAREVEQLMARSEQEPMPIDPMDLLAEVAADVRDEYPDVEVTVEGPADADAALPSRGILAPVLTNLVENAAEHNDATDPSVAVNLAIRDPRGDPDRHVEVTVADNGPGIPPQEREVLLEGTETALKHGSGLGLWLVYWGVESLGGEVAFEDNHPRGSVVRITLPLRPDPGAGDLEAALDSLEAAVDTEDAEGVEVRPASDG